MEVYFATKNENKLISLRKDLSSKGISVIQEPIELIEPRIDDVKIVALSKVEQAYLQINKPCFAIDAGFYITALNDYPGAFVKNMINKLGNKKLLKLMEGEDRHCEFRECLAYEDGKVWEPQTFMAYVKGSLAYEERGKMRKGLWSKLGLVFIPEGSNKTLAEMSVEEYNNWRKINKEKTSVGYQLGEFLSTTSFIH